jgi:hypothetical protein
MKATRVKLPKVRSDAKLSKLTLAQKEEVASWLSNGLGYEAARDKIARDFGVWTSVGALSNFWAVFVAPRLLSERLQDIALSEQTLFALVIEVKADNEVVIRAVKGPKSAGGKKA